MRSPVQTLSWHDPTVPARDEVVLRYVLERHAREKADQVFVLFSDGSHWTYAQALEIAQQSACGLTRLGVKQGDRVLSWLPNGADALRTWFGANWLGATYVPINTAYRGALLEHVISNAGASVMVCHSAFEERLNGIALANLSTVVIADCDELPPLSTSCIRHPGTCLKTDVDHDLLDLSRPIEPWDEQSIIYTSGTTGPSKGVLSSYCHCATTALVAFEDKDSHDLRYMLTLPLFHAGGTIGVMGPLLLGRSFAVTERFETDQFWNVVRATRSTCCTLLGAMATFLTKQPPRENEDDHSLEWAFILPLTEEAHKFSKRFGTTVYTLFNMTEISVPMLSGPNPSTLGSCGCARTGVSLRLVDEHDVEVPIGSVGELIVRTDRPWAMNHGYNAMPEATAEAWRNGWFHTGDAFRQSPEGEFYFVDRIKDAIRRRGENISSFEVEQECIAFPAVREAAAIAIPSEFGEDDVMVVVAPTKGAAIEPRDFLEFLQPRMAHFMLPRYIRVMPELPKTPTEKVQKAELRKHGVTQDTWDREAHGIHIKADIPSNEKKRASS